MAKHTYVKTRLEALLNESFESFYWMGMIAADGTINHKTWRIKLQLAVKDQQQVEKFGLYVNCPVKGSSVHAQDKYTVPLIAQRFDLKPRKTYYPPDLSWMSGDALVAFAIGFIDGDGNIKKQYQRRDALIRIKTHASWQEALRFLSVRLHEMAGAKANEPILNAQGYATLNICNTKVVRFLKKKAICLNLPCLERKWSLIDEAHESRYEKADLALKRIEEMFLAGAKQKTICQELGLSPARVCTIIKKTDLKARRLACI